MHSSASAIPENRKLALDGDFKCEELHQNSQIVSDISINTLDEGTVFFAECRFHHSCYRPVQFQQLGVVFPDALSTAVRKRQAEFLAGRFMAKLALSKLGFSEGNVAIGHHRQPVWPDGAIGSISHSASMAVCVAATSQHLQGIGVDIELWLDNTQGNQLSNGIVNRAEQALLAAIDAPFSHLLTIVFSAKESLFKALYCQVKGYFDMLDASIVNFTSEQKTLVLSINRDLSDDVRAGQTYTCNFQTLNTHVLTLVKVK